MTAWLLILTLYQLDATSPRIVVPNIVSEGECQRLADAIYPSHGHRGPVQCIPYEVAR